MPIDTKTLGTNTPKTLDGRSYPKYLRAFERYDPEMLRQVAELQQPTLNKLAVEAPDPKMRSAVSPWIASAEWRGLISRVEEDEMLGKRRYQLTDLGTKQLAERS
jgi:hypothetical protein